MSEEQRIRDFIVKFNELNEDNQKYIIAIQQALTFAQTREKTAKEPEHDRAS